MFLTVSYNRVSYTVMLTLFSSSISIYLNSKFSPLTLLRPVISICSFVVSRVPAAASKTVLSVFADTYREVVGRWDTVRNDPKKNRPEYARRQAIRFRERSIRPCDERECERRPLTDSAGPTLDPIERLVGTPHTRPRAFIL